MTAAECDPISEYMGVVDAIYGVYLDSTTGFRLLLKRLTEGQRTSLRMLKRKHPDLASVDYLDRTSFSYGRGDPNEPDSYELHRVSQGEVKARNSVGSANYRFIGNMALVALYQYWEDFYRSRIAEYLGKKRDELQAAVMGDLRHLRRSVIHHRGIALPEVANCEVLTWFSPGEKVFVDGPKMEELVLHLKQMLTGLGQTGR